MGVELNTDLTIGAIPIEANVYRFSVWAPYANNLSLEILHNDIVQKINMTTVSDGFFSSDVEWPDNPIQYYYQLDENTKYPDPASRFQPQGIYGPSQTINYDYEWTDLTWMGLPLDKYFIYELHVGTFTDEGTFKAVIPYLDELKELGITAIELMPVAQFSGDRNWGYDGVFPYAVQNSYGGPLDLKELVNECHKRQISVILDVVYNHLGPEGNILEKFGPYFTSRYQTPWGKAINYDDAYCHRVRRFFIENAMHWFIEYHIDALRLDALHAIFDQSAYPFLQELADHIDTLSKKMGKKYYLIAESDLNNPRIVLPSAKGGYGLDAQWNDDFHHALHTIITGENKGYYHDFGTVAQFVEAYKNGYVYSGQYSPFRKRPHGGNSNDLEASQLVVFSQNHDQIGNRKKGDRLSTMVDFATLKLIASLVITSPYIPLLFMGEEYGELAPFAFFTSYKGSELIEMVREGRKREFSSFGWSGDIPDPQALSTFLQSKLNHELKTKGQHKILLAYYKKLINLRKNNNILSYLNNKNITIEFDEEKKSLVINRFYQHHRLLIICHFNPVETIVRIATSTVNSNTYWQKLLYSFDKEWEGEKIESGMITSSERKWERQRSGDPLAMVKGGDIILPPFGFVMFEDKAPPREN